MQTEQQTHYQRIGGAEKVRALVRRFYELMDELPEAYGIRKLHADDLQGANDKLFKFLSGWPPHAAPASSALCHWQCRARPVDDVHESGAGRGG
jgi:truncated hemoglobin YjbI